MSLCLLSVHVLFINIWKNQIFAWGLNNSCGDCECHFFFFVVGLSRTHYYKLFKRAITSHSLLSSLQLRWVGILCI